VILRGGKIAAAQIVLGLREKLIAARGVGFDLCGGGLLLLLAALALCVGRVDLGLGLVKPLLCGHVAGVEDQDLFVDAECFFRRGCVERVHGELANLLLLRFVLRRLAGEDDGDRHGGCRWAGCGRCGGSGDDGRGGRRQFGAFGQCGGADVTDVERGFVTLDAEAKRASRAAVGAFGARVVVVGYERAIDPHSETVRAGDDGAGEILSGRDGGGGAIFAA
jgi:hypothetical protein